MHNDQKTNEQPGSAAQSGPACIHDDILTLRSLALQVKAHPHQRAAAAGFEALARIADDLAHRLDAIEAAEAMRKPCEGCGCAEDQKEFGQTPVNQLGGRLAAAVAKLKGGM